MEKDFGAWLEGELRQRDWSVRELARRADLDPTGLSRIIHGKRGVTHATAEHLAQALGYDSQFVKERAGLVKTALFAEIDPAARRLAQLLNELPEPYRTNYITLMQQQAEWILALLNRHKGAPDPELETLRELDPALARAAEQRAKQLQKREEHNGQ